MLNGFEKHTEPLTDYERNELLPIVIQGLKIRIGAGMAITNRKMTQALVSQGYKVNEARVRKLINHIRNNALVKRLVATSNGYFVATDVQTMQCYIDTLRGREAAIRAVRESMEKQLNEWT